MVGMQAWALHRAHDRHVGIAAITALVKLLQGKFGLCDAPDVHC